MLCLTCMFTFSTALKSQELYLVTAIAINIYIWLRMALYSGLIIMKLM